MKFRRVLLIAMLVLTMVAQFSFSGAQSDDGYLRFPITSDPTLLNPLLSELIANSQVINNIFEGLVRFDPRTGEFSGGIAESWELSEDQLTYTFNIRPGVLFHQIDGVTYAEGEREVKADDILWNYTTALNPDTEISILAEGLTMIAGATEFSAGEAETVSGLEVVDDYTFRITLTAPDRLFLVNGNLSIISPEAYAQLGDEFNNKPVGTGPFQFVEWLREDRLTLTANPDYWDTESAPQIAGIHFVNYADPNTALLAYRANEVDFLFSFPTGQRNAIIEEFGEEFQELPGLHLRYFGFDMSQGFFAENKLVRQAFSHALDRVTAWDIVGEGARFPATLGMLVPAMPASTPATVYDFDLERAAELLAEAGFPNGEGMPPIKMWVLSSIASEPHIVVWQEALAQLGVEVEIVVEESGTYFDSIIDNPEAILFVNGWAAGIPDPSDVFNFLILEGRGSMEYDNPVVNELLLQAMSEPDEAVRTELYQQVHDIVMDDAVVVPSAYSKITWLQKPWVQGFNPAGGGIHTAPLSEISLGE